MFRSSFGKERGLLPCYDWRKTHRIILSLRRHPQAWSIYLNDKMAIRTSTCFRSSSHTGAEMRFQDTMSISKKISAWSRHTDLDIPLLSTGQTGPGSLKGESTIQISRQDRSACMCQTTMRSDHTGSISSGSHSMEPLHHLIQDQVPYIEPSSKTHRDSPPTHRRKGYQGDFSPASPRKSYA
jgi:hypothetical protein